MKLIAGARLIPCEKTETKIADFFCVAISCGGVESTKIKLYNLSHTLTPKNTQQPKNVCVKIKNENMLKQKILTVHVLTQLVKLALNVVRATNLPPTNELVNESMPLWNSNNAKKKQDAKRVIFYASNKKLLFYGVICFCRKHTQSAKD
eukprot:GEMP01103136.1.p1 GENE.GEMP01103136.1~~GEMP01103136.1.p1  ORF type:complete len:149 (-),score=0.23 GEMP01103136.1:142-588(-)